MVDLNGQYQSIKEEINSAIAKVIESSAFIKGPAVQKFQKNLERFLGVKHVIPCGNGTDALQLALMALDLERGDEVITTPFTFVATVEVISLLGLKPVFVDIDPDTFNLDAHQIEEKITDKTKCIIPVHLFGQSCDMTPILDIAEKHNLKIIEDTAQAIGANIQIGNERKMCSTVGDIGTFSFFPSKNLGAFGDGGAVCTNDDKLAERIALFANHGSKVKYVYDDIGINSRLDGIQAAILDVKLKYLADYQRKRVEAADRYDALLKEVDAVTVPVRREDRNHVFHQYTLKIEGIRDEVKKKLSENGIPTGIYYPSPLHIQKVYNNWNYKEGDFSIAESMCKCVISLPMHTELTLDMQSYIIEILKKAI